ncbi:hypothetical protein PIB30_058777 [Stylosanthes scabra]|uniref:Uncharacterized protein n=1 Tax=Stylosanthes scabra TaxID=79078 RepID=A0ABU6UKL0_9FABA|nr:hypothetical protein [Stylosanthes scabra]
MQSSPGLSKILNLLAKPRSVIQEGIFYELDAEGFDMEKHVELEASSAPVDSSIAIHATIGIEAFRGSKLNEFTPRTSLRGVHHTATHIPYKTYSEDHVKIWGSGRLKGKISTGWIPRSNPLQELTTLMGPCFRKERSRECVGRVVIPAAVKGVHVAKFFIRDERELVLGDAFQSEKAFRRQD